MGWHFMFFQAIFPLLYLHSLAHLCNDTSFSSKLLYELSRAQKGNTVNGVSELKHYLSFYGYLNHHDHDNTFDDSLELALKKYQWFFKLNVTGILDQKTLTKMCQPRCGMPDFVNPNVETLPLHKHYSFLRGKPRWHTMNLTYSFDWNVRKEAKSPLQLALNEWASVAPFKFHYMVKNFSRANIKFSFMSGDHGDHLPFLGLRQLAHSFPPPDGRIHFDNHQVWSWTGKKNAYDVQTIGLHELGHALGLDHSGIFNAVMYPIVNSRVIKKLTQDDIDGIRALYNLKKK